jgi:hypothetical protein
MAQNLMCNGSRSWRCWNSVGISGELAAEKVVAAILAELERLEGFDDQLRAIVEAARHTGGADRAVERARLDEDEQEWGRRRDNVAEAIAKRGLSPTLEGKLAEIDSLGRELARRRRKLDRSTGRPPDLPDSAAGLRRVFEEKARDLAADTPEYGDILRQLVPEFRVHLVRSCDGGHPLPVARVKLSLAGIIPDAARAPEYVTALTRELTIDLFEPTQRERIRAEAARLSAEGLGQREIAERIPERPTQPAVANALALDRLMRERGLDSPYEVLKAPPEDYGRLRLYKNPKYRFELEEGYTPPEL